MDTCMLFFLSYPIQIIKKKKKMLNPSDVDWMEADLKVRLLSIKRKRQSLSRINDWRSLAYTTREK